MLVIIGPYCVAAQDHASGSRRLDDTGDWVRQEVEAGLARPELAVVPVLVDGATMPENDDLPPGLQPLTERNAFVLTGADLDQEVDALVENMQKGQVGPLRRAGRGQSPTGGQDSVSARRKRARFARR